MVWYNMDKKFVISLVGAPASGKGYIASCIERELVNKYGFKGKEISDVSMGELIRRESKANTVLGQKLSSSMKKGGLAPDDLVNQILIDELHKLQAKVLILDGYPRTVAQVKKFDQLMEGLSSAVIFRDTPKELILARVKNRRICSVCGKGQDVHNGKCVYCGGELVKRKDDEVLPERLNEYEKMTKPAVLELKNEGKNFFYYDGLTEGEDIAQHFLQSNSDLLK